MHEANRPEPGGKLAVGDMEHEDLPAFFGDIL